MREESKRNESQEKKKKKIMYIIEEQIANSIRRRRIQNHVAGDEERMSNPLPSANRLQFKRLEIKILYKMAKTVKNSEGKIILGKRRLLYQRGKIEDVIERERERERERESARERESVRA